MDSENNKKIARNTLLLYVRMAITMLVSFYTARVVLHTLGETDFGIYDVVGGIVMMFAFLSNTMASASQRFFAYELGRNNYVQLKKIFSLSVVIFFGIAAVILLFAETVGLWYLNNKMTIPAERFPAANWVYQFSIFSFIIIILTIPYNAAIIAREKMSVFAYVSIIDVILKLLIVYLLVLFSYDKLKLYAVLSCGVTTTVMLIYIIYCRKNFEECHFSIYWDKPLFMEIVSYSGWNMIGSTASILKEQGVNLLLNSFFNPTVNAARAVANQLNMALLSFTNNFYTAVRPQIVKSYVSGDKQHLEQLVFKSAKIGFYLLMLPTLPVILDTNYVLSIWLTKVPYYAVIFTKLILINVLINSMNIPFVNAIQATGSIKRYQLTVSSLYFLILPVTYLFLKLGYSPQISMYVSIAVSLLCYIPRLLIFKKTTGIPFSFFLKSILPVVAAVFCITLLPILLAMHYLELDENFFRFMLISSLSVIWGMAVIFFIGLDKTEKYFLKNKIHHYATKFSKRIRTDKKD